jgi:hypothetical protein
MTNSLKESLLGFFFVVPGAHQKKVKTLAPGTKKMKPRDSLSCL